jgi:aminoglycoside phosphotransferase (APT) family kinase protein
MVHVLLKVTYITGVARGVFSLVSSTQRFAVAGSVGRTAVAVLRDRVSPPVARTAADVPAGLRDITADWLSRVLHPVVPGVEVSALSIDGTSAGTSVRGRLHLQYRTQLAAAPPTLFAKTTPSFVTRIANGVTGTSVTEAGFYRHLRPRLSVEAPIGYHCATDERSGRSIQLIEDLVRSKAATFWSPASTLSLGEAQQLVGELASLHAAGARLSEVVDRRPDYLRSYGQWWSRALAIGGVKRGHLQGVSAAVSNGVAAPELRGRGHELWDAFTRSVDIHEELMPTLLHGDAHLGNWYVTGAGKMGLCDWQCVAVGHWSRDLAYALASALEVEQRRAWERELVALYLDESTARGMPATHFDRAWQLYRSQMLGALVMWTPTYRPPVWLPRMQPTQITEEMLRRITAAVVDLDSLTA